MFWLLLLWLLLGEGPLVEADVDGRDERVEYDRDGGARCEGSATECAWCGCTSA